MLVDLCRCVICVVGADGTMRVSVDSELRNGRAQAPRSDPHQIVDRYMDAEADGL